VYEQSDAACFIRLFALPARVRAVKDQELGIAPTADAPTPEATSAEPRALQIA